MRRERRHTIGQVRRHSSIAHWTSGLPLSAQTSAPWQNSYKFDRAFYKQARPTSLYQFYPKFPGYHTTGFRHVVEFFDPPRTFVEIVTVDKEVEPTVEMTSRFKCAKIME
ncbi:hypothetical protein Alches_14100 [Alicyclobacillus hesperidum subsp. aegles]|nr:hypothetical protein Alches_14100 [Alicyclobacillus hesperidum subsp. aegles]